MLPQLTASQERRFWSHVMKTQTCWLWTAWSTRNGYGRVRLFGHSHPAHRVAFVLNGGIIPDGYDLDHLCRVRHCVNPAHLEPVTRLENNRRGLGNPLRLQTHCKYGHSLADAYVAKAGNRHCRECGHRREHAYRRRKLEAKRATADLAYSDTARGEEGTPTIPASMNNPRYPPRQSP